MAENDAAGTATQTPSQGGSGENRMAAGDQEERDLAKQVITYADAVTAFSAAQNAAFAYAVMKGPSDGFAQAILTMSPRLSIGSLLFATALYVLFVSLCYRGESKLLGVPDSRKPSIRAVVKGMRLTRLGIIFFGAVVAIGTLMYACKHC
jgi:hypothetical protein